MDLVAIWVSFETAYSLYRGQWTWIFVSTPPFVLMSFIVLPLIFYIFDLYYPFKYFSRTQTVIDVSLSTAIGMAVLAIIAYADRTFLLSRSIIFYTAIVLIPAICATRILYDTLFKSRFLDKRALILGTGKLATEITRVIRETPHSGIEVVGLVSEKQKSSIKSRGGIPVLGGSANLVSLLDWYHIDMIIMALDTGETVSEASVMATLLERQVTVTSAIHLFEKISGEVPYQLFGSHYLLALMAQVKTKPYLKIKRLIDIFFSVFLLAALFPLLLAAMAALSITMPGKVIFVQQRIGLGSKPFRLIKLRTMKDIKKSKQPRITRLGAWMRKFRIDEIPQLINVIRGDMSLIGPRPEIPYFVNRCRDRIPFYDSVFAVKPGLTGWAQVKFRHTRSARDYDQKFRYNLYYLKNLSLTLDLMILVKTIRVVILGKGE